MPLIDTTGVRPVDRRQPTDDVSRVRRRDEGTSSAFRPQTNVALKTAIKDLAATLSKISTEEKYGIQKMPKEIGDVVKNILRQAFSMDATLGKGIGSTIESQRFSMDQLMLFSRLLSQMGVLAERNYSMRLGDETQLLLANLKDAVVAENGGEELEPVLMTKSAFELVDAKVAEQLPQALYEMLAQLANMPTANQQSQPPSESMQFLKQLVRYFIPRPEVDDFAQEQENKSLQQEPQSQQGQQTRSPSAAAQKFLDSMFRNFGGKFANQPQQTTTQPQPQGQPTQFNQSQPQGQPAQFNQSQPQGQPTQFNQAQPQGQPTQFNQAQTQGQPAQFNQSQQQSQPAQFNQSQQQSQPAQFNQSQPQGQPAQFNQSQPQSQPAQFNQAQPQGQPAQFNQSQPQGQPTQFNQSQSQGQPAQFNQAQPQGQPTQFNQAQPQSQPAQFNQAQPQSQPTQFNQAQSQGQPAQFNQSQPQGQPAQFNQAQPQGQPAQFNQSQPQRQPTQFNQSQSQGQPAQFNQSQPQSQPAQFNQSQGQSTQFNQSQPQSQPTQFNQSQGQSTQFNQSQPQSQPAQFNQSQPQGQPAQFNQAQPQSQPAQFNQAQPQGQPAQFNQSQPQGQPTQFNQSQPQGQPAQFNQSQPQGQPAQFNQAQPQGQPAQFNQAQPQSQPTQFNQAQPQGQPAQFNQSQTQSQPAQFNQSQPQGQLAQFNQSQTQSQPAQFNQAQPQSQPAQFNQAQPQGQPAQFNQSQPQSQPAQFNQSQPQGQPAQLNQQPQGQPAQLNQSQPQGQPTQLNQQPQGQLAQLNQQPQGQPAQLNQQPQSQQPQEPPPEIPLPTFPLNRKFVVRQRDFRKQMESDKNELIKTNLLNTPQTLNTMKNLADFLVKNTDMNSRDAALFKNFINNSQEMMPETEARHLQNLLRLCQQNIPFTVRQAAVQQNLPDLPRLWAFMQMCDMANINLKMTPKALKRAGKDVAAFATSMRGAMSSDNAVVQNQRSFQMMVPLYMGDNETSYPTYFNIYDENNSDPETGENKKETWVRICILTDHVGAVELVFRIYDETKLDMRFYFSQSEIAKEFGDIYVNELKKTMKNYSLTLGEISVGSVGEGLFNYT